MKKTQIKDALRNIWKQKVSYLSIVVIAMLGVTIFLGIDYASEALRINGTAYYRETAFRDVEIVSTMLLSEQDLSAIRETEGVQDVEAVYQTTGKVASGSARKDASVISMTERINVSTVSEGRMPETGRECAVERPLANEMGWKIGDTIEITNGENGTAEFLTGTTFTITGIAAHPEHACTGLLKSFYIIVTRDAFDLTALDGCCMKAEVLADRPIDMNRFTSGYRTTVRTARESFEEVAKVREPIREAEARERIDENRRKLEDAEAELADGRAKLDAAAEQLREGEQQYADGLQKLEDGRKQLDETKQQLDDAKRQLDEGRKQLDDAKAELDAGAEQLDAAAAEVDSGRRKLVSGWNRIESVKTQIRDQLKGGLDDLIEEDSSQWIDWAEPQAANPDSRHAVAGDFRITEDFQINFGSSLSGKIREILNTAEIPDRVLRKAFEVLGGEGEYDPAAAEKLLSERLASLAGEYQQDYDALAAGCTEWDKGHKVYLAGLRQYREARAKYEEGLAQYEAGEAEYADALKQYEDGLRRYLEGEAQYEQGLKEMEDARRQLDEARAKLEDGEREYADGLRQFEEGKGLLADAEKRADALGPCKWIVVDTYGNAGFVQIKAASDNLKSMEMTFALLFVLVGALVIYATVSKMVDEQRRLIGTTKALGFFNREIFAKYLLFGISATLLGCVLGLLLSRFWIEGFITRGYNLYFEPDLTKPVLILLPTLIVFLAGTLLAFFSIWFACVKLLRLPAVKLMQQSIPKGRKKAAAKKAKGSLYSRLILLNIRSDLRRVIVTVISVAGCCALVIIGCTLRQAFSNAPQLQMKNIIHYDGTVTVDPSANGRAVDTVSGILSDAGAAGCPISRREATIRIRDLDVQELICGDLNAINEMIRLADVKTGEPLAPSGDGVLISKRFSENYELSVGDSFTFALGGTESVQVQVLGVFEDYVSGSMYMSGESFRHLFGRDPEPNAILVRLDGAALKPLLKNLGAVDGFENYARSDSFKKLFETATGVMNMVVLLFIFMAAIMAGVVLMNLTNIYIMQKMPELTIMRINGFTVKESIGYVLRETVVTTTAGIVLGIALGSGIGYKIVRSLEQSFVQLDRRISILAWLVGIGLTVVFTVVVNAIALKKVRKLKLTDM